MAVATGAQEALAAIALGATILQLRSPGLSARRLLEEAVALVARSSVPVVISSRADVAAAAGAGVNLPEEGLPVAAARRLLGPEALVGRSTHSPEAAREAEREGADYVLFGPVWETASHPRRPGRGLRELEALARSLAIPVIAIGGVDRSRLQQCLDAGAAGYAAIGAFRT